MMKKIPLDILFLLIGFWANAQFVAVDYVLEEKDLIPEGVAYNSHTEEVYVGSIFKQKIIALKESGEVNVLFDDFDQLSPVGMAYDSTRKILWVNVALSPLVNQSNRRGWITTIISIDTETGNLKRKYPVLTSQEAVFLNDLTVTQSGQVYATESVGGSIYTIEPDAEQIKLFHRLDGFSFPNGITHNIDHLFIATDQGIVRLKIENKELILLKTEDDVNAGVIDGLALYKDYFIGHQSTKVSKFFCDEDFTKITGQEILDEGDEFDSSTTGEINDGWYHFIVNSQLKTGVDQELKQIMPMDSLENVIIRKIKL